MGLPRDHVPMKRVGMVVMVMVDGKAGGMLTKQFDEGRVTTDLLGMA